MNDQPLISAPLISARGIRKEFRSGEVVTQVLHGIDLDVNAGELSFLVGQSGCGKTTLISIMSGILSPTAGTITYHIDGESTDLFKLRDGRRVVFRRDHIGFIFQQYSLLEQLTAAENAAITLVASGVPLGKAVAKTRDMLGELGLGDHMHKYPKQLSGGQQQRVAIARALVHEPEFLVCDEPTAALDAETGHQVMDLLRDVASAPERAVLVVTHDNRIFEFADRIVSMNDGNLVDDKRQSADKRESSSADLEVAL
ncbi:MAG: ABC transporter ATP-binding protein [Planctomycetota bacterium]